MLAFWTAAIGGGAASYGSWLIFRVLALKQPPGNAFLVRAIRALSGAAFYKLGLGSLEDYVSQKEAGRPAKEKPLTSISLDKVGFGNASAAKKKSSTRKPQVEVERALREF
jgi:hypothetical protein